MLCIPRARSEYMYNYPSHMFHLSSGSDALRIAICLFHRHLRTVIAEGTADENYLSSVLHTLIVLNPFQVTDNEELGFLWIADILNSGYEDGARCRLACEVLRVLRKRFPLDSSAPFMDVHPTWIPPVLSFLTLCGKLENTWWPLNPALAAIRILSTSSASSDFATEILPILMSTLLPTHPLRSRVLALEIFKGSMSGWFSPQMESVPGEALDNLLQAVGDPFKFLDPPLQDGKPVALSRYQPMVAAVVLIEFASSDLWRNHLRHSNFASCEEVVSTRDGKWSAFVCMAAMRNGGWPKLLGTATKISTAIRCLEGLRCFNTAEVVIMWAWTTGVANPMGCNDENLIGCETLRFYQTHGTRLLAALKQHILEAAKEHDLIFMLHTPQIRGSRGFIPMSHPHHGSLHWYGTYLSLAQSCQVRRLYHLFGYDQATWNEAVEVVVEGEAGPLPGRSVTPASFVDWACDYP